MIPTPSPDTVEPTEADYALALALLVGGCTDRKVVATAIRQHVAAEVARETAELRRALSEISTHAHCLTKAGPLNTPTLDAAWGHFMRLSVMATSALHHSRITEIQETQKQAHTVDLKLD